MGRTTAVLVREDKAVLLPALPGRLPLRFLCLEVRAEKVNKLFGETYRTAAGAGLGGGQLWVGSPPIRAVPGRFASAGLCAPVGVLRPVATAADNEEPTLKVHVLPLQPQHLALAQSEGEGEGDGPPCRVAMLVSGLEQPLNLLDAVGLHLVLPCLWGLGQLNGVPTEVSSPHGLIEGGAKGAMYLVSRPGLAAVGLHVRVEHLDVLGLEPVETVGPQAGDTVVEFAIGVHAASRFAWSYDFKVPDSAKTEAEGVSK